MLPGIVGSLQALEALKVVLGAGETLAGRLLLIDALAGKVRQIELRRDPECPVCGDHPTQRELIDYELFCGMGGGGETVGVAEPEPVREVEPEEAAALLDGGGSGAPYLLDVREPFEWEICNLGPQGAVLVPLRELGSRLEELPRDRDILVYCRSGGRSRRAAEALREAGFPRVMNLGGGILRWGEKLDPGMAGY